MELDPGQLQQILDTIAAGTTNATLVGQHAVGWISGLVVIQCACLFVTVATSVAAMLAPAIRRPDSDA